MTSTSIQIRLKPDKLAWLDAEAKRLGIGRATVIQMLIQTASTTARKGKGGGTGMLSSGTERARS